MERRNVQMNYSHIVNSCVFLAFAIAIIGYFFCVHEIYFVILTFPIICNFIVILKRPVDIKNILYTVFV